MEEVKIRNLNPHHIESKRWLSLQLSDSDLSHFVSQAADVAADTRRRQRLSID
jgi:hypothetical protein